VTDLKSHGAEIVRQVGTTGRPVVLSKHGRAVAVLVSVDEYEDLVDARERAALRAAVDEAEAEIVAGQVVPHAAMQERFAQLRRGK